MTVCYPSVKSSVGDINYCLLFCRKVVIAPFSFSMTMNTRCWSCAKFDSSILKIWWWGWLITTYSTSTNDWIYNKYLFLHHWNFLLSLIHSWFLHKTYVFFSLNKFILSKNIYLTNYLFSLGVILSCWMAINKVMLFSLCMLCFLTAKSVRCSNVRGYT